MPIGVTSGFDLALEISEAAFQSILISAAVRATGAQPPHGVRIAARTEDGTAEFKIYTEFRQQPRIELDADGGPNGRIFLSGIAFAFGVETAPSIPYRDYLTEVNVSLPFRLRIEGGGSFVRGPRTLVVEIPGDGFGVEFTLAEPAGFASAVLSHYSMEAVGRWLATGLNLLVGSRSLLVDTAASTDAMSTFPVTEIADIQLQHIAATEITRPSLVFLIATTVSDPSLSEFFFLDRVGRQPPGLLTSQLGIFGASAAMVYDNEFLRYVILRAIDLSTFPLLRPGHVDPATLPMRFYLPDPLGRQGARGVPFTLRSPLATNQSILDDRALVAQQLSVTVDADQQNVAASFLLTADAVALQVAVYVLARTGVSVGETTDMRGIVHTTLTLIQLPYTPAVHVRFHDVIVGVLYVLGAILAVVGTVTGAVGAVVAGFYFWTLAVAAGPVVDWQGSRFGTPMLPSGPAVLLVLPSGLRELIGRFDVISAHIDDLTVVGRLSPPHLDPLYRELTSLTLAPGDGVDLDGGVVVSLGATAEYDADVDLAWCAPGTLPSLCAVGGGRMAALADHALDTVTLERLQALEFRLGGSLPAVQIPTLAEPPPIAGATRSPPRVIAARTGGGRLAKVAVWCDAAWALHIRFAVYDTPVPRLAVGQRSVVLGREQVGAGFDERIQAAYEESLVTRRVTFHPQTERMRAPLRCSWHLDGILLEGTGSLTREDGATIDFEHVGERGSLLLGRGVTLDAVLELAAIDADGLEAHARASLRYSGIERRYDRSELYERSNRLAAMLDAVFGAAPVAEAPVNPEPWDQLPQSDLVQGVTDASPYGEIPPAPAERFRS